MRINKLFVAIGLILVLAISIGWWVIVSFGYSVVNRGQTNCRGEQATIVVNSGEEITATSERDVIVILGSGAEVWTQQGDDLVCVYGPPAESPEAYHGSRIYLGPGNNTAITYGGSNYIFGSNGNDLIYLNGNYEDVEAGDGADTIWALGATSAHIDGQGGIDTIYGSPGGDNITGGSSGDFIMGNGGNDNLDGESGNDTLFGGTGQDTLNGGADNDFCSDHDQNTTFSNCETIDQPTAPPFPESS